MKRDKLDDIIRSLVTRHLNLIVFGFLLMCSVVARYHLMKHGTSSDYTNYLVPWVEAYKQSIRSAFREGVGNYYIPYNVLLAIASKLPIPTNYSVGLISCIFDYLTCIYIFRILSETFSGTLNKVTITAISIGFLFLPTIILNGAAWKQCDAIYTFFLLVCLKSLLDGKMKTAFIMLGVAFSFKQQAIFLVPLIIILYFLDKRIKIVYLFYTVLVYLIAGLPAIIMGRPALEVYSIYLGQTSTYHEMTLNYPNLYMVAMTNYERAHLYAVILTIVVFAMAFLYIVGQYSTLSAKNIAFLAAWSVWTCCMFLPAMHQRYDYMVVILLVICVPLVKKEKSVMAIISMILFNAGNILTYSRSLFGDDYNPLFTFCCNAAAYFLFNYILWKSISEEKA